MVEDRKRSRVQNALLNIMFILVSAFCVLPILYILSASFNSTMALAEHGYTLIPREFTLEAYEYVMKAPKQLLSAYGVTITVTVIGTVISLLLTSMLAYVLARKDFKWRFAISFYVLIVCLFSGGTVGSYLINTRVFHLRNNLLVLILPMLITPMNVFMMKGFFADLPDSLIEASKLDGCSEVGTFFKIVAPISIPAFATIGLFTAFNYWNEWWLSMMYIDDIMLSSLQFYLYRIMNSIQFMIDNMRRANVPIDLTTFPSESARMALCVLAAGPMLIVFPFFQKYFIKGLTIGSIKG